MTNTELLATQIEDHKPDITDKQTSQSGTTTATTPKQSKKRSSSSDDPSPKKPKGKGTKSNGNGMNKTWTSEEKIQLLQFALKNGVPGGENGWEGVVEGRNGSQCRSAWRVYPALLKALGGDEQKCKAE